ncbi:MAG: SCO family protein [Gammaproteobacteria bacterium]|nr:SCO family protein [Gammaproteobacteria bacterium]
MNDANESVGPEWFNGKWSFLFFGYTYCPDICPLTMTTLDKAYNQLNEEGIIDNARVVFLSVDPQRDKPERLAEYMRYFNAAFHGATGSEQQLENITRQLSVVYIPPKPEDGETDYIVDHSSSIILIDPDASAHAVFSAPHSPENIVDGFRKIINRWQQLYTS